MYIRFGLFLLVVLWLIYVFMPLRNKKDYNKILNAYLKFVDEKLKNYQRMTNVHNKVAFTDSTYYEVMFDMKKDEGYFLHKKSKSQKTIKLVYNKKINKIEEE